MDIDQKILHPSVDEWQITAVGGLDLSALIIISVGITVAIVWTWRSLDPIHALGDRLAITALRALALVTGLGLLVQPTLHVRKLLDAPSQLAILVDVSGSMALGRDKTRLSETRKMLKQAQNDLSSLSKKFELVWYRFADELAAATEQDKATKALEQSSKTDLVGTINQLASISENAPLDGLVLISDGADTELAATEGGGWDTGWARKLGIPINTVFMGGGSKRKDLSIERAEVDSFAFSRSKTLIAVTLRSVGLPDREVEAFLWQDGSVVQRRTVTLVGGKGQLSFTVFPSTLGQHVLSVTVPTPADDEIPENNRAHLAFDVIRDKFRILHLAGQPSWDQRFLRETLQSWPRVDLVSFYILRTAYQSMTLGSQGMALIPFPTDDIFKDHLNEFDIIIFQSFDPASVGVDRYLDQIADFVKQGGAIVIMGGTSGLSGSKMASQELKETLPVNLLGHGTRKSRLTDTNQFRIKLTEAGANHPMMQLKSSPKKNAEYWRSLARLDGIGRVAALSEGAFRLAEHPFVQADDGPAPVIAVKEVDKGRALAITTDSLWRWRFTGPMGGGPLDAYATFWRQAVSWLSRAPELDRLRAKVSPSPVSKGKPTTIDIELVDEAYKPVPAAKVSCVISWIGQDGVEATEAFEAQLDGKGRYRREWVPSVEGPHRLAATTKDGLSSTEPFLVEMQKKELSHLEPDESLLKAIAESTGGHFESGTFTPRKFVTNGGAARHVLSHSDIPLWDHPISILLLIGLLTAEWLLRRKVGLS